MPAMMKFAGVDWNQVLFLDAFAFENHVGPRRRLVLRHLKRNIFCRLEIPSNATAEYLCFRSLVRSDYKNLFSQVVDTIDAPKIVIQDYFRPSRKPNFSVLLGFFLSIPTFFKLSQFPIRTRIFVYVQLCFYTTVVRKVCRLSFNKLLCFADMQPVENLLAQCVNNKTTITLQHGLYVDYQDEETINVVNYRHQACEYFLAWGKDTANLIMRYHPNHKTVVCGKPNLERIANKSPETCSDFFTVIFDQNQFHRYNQSLLQIAYELSRASGIKFVLRLHPWNDPESYELLPQHILQDRPIEESKFVVGHTTSLIYELMRVGVPVFKLKSDEHSLAIPSHLEFSNAQELAQITENLHSKNKFVEAAMIYIECLGEESVSKYRNFFQQLDSPQN